MNHNFSRSLKAFGFIIITTLILSFTFQGKGVIPAQAKSSDSRNTKSALSQVAQDIPTETPTPQAVQSGQLHNKTKSKESLDRLTTLINASVANAPGATDTAYLKKLDSHLQDMVSAQLSGANVVETAKANDLHISDNKAVLMDIYVNGTLDQAVSQLEGMGMQVLATNDSLGKVVEGYLPLESVLPAARLDFTKALLPVMAISVDTGSVTSQGDGAHNGPAARALGPTGSGVVAGIISDSMNQVGTGLNGSKTTGDLPASMTIYSEQAGGTDEGRAMAEIIYDTAPGITSMYFGTGTNGPVGKAAAINYFAVHGVRVIADDVTDFSEPFFQDGMVAQAVDNAYNSGAAYFPSAGNYARQSYESNYRDTGNSFHAHDFDPGVGTAWLQTITTVPNGGCINAALQWDDPWGAATHDFDFYLHNTADLNPNDILAGSASDNIATGIPFEFIHWCNTTGSSMSVGDEIDLFAGTSTAFLKYIAYDNYGTTFSINQWDTASEAIGPDAASASGAMTVAAVRWNQAGLNNPELFSSRGPSITRLFNTGSVRLGSPDVRPKPNIAGADCVVTSNNFAGGVGFGGGTFCGTSAAAPSVAGVAALVLSANPSLTPGQLYAVLGNSANTIDCALAGNPDADCGFGFVLANKAVAGAFPPTLSSPTGNIGMNSNPTYTWSQKNGETWYYLWVDGPSGTVIKHWYTTAQAACNGTTCSLATGITLAPGAYTWYVQTWNPAGYGHWSTGMSFTVTAPPPPGAATLVTPNGSIGTSSPTYTWNEVSGATWYFLWVNGSSGNVFKKWYTTADAACNGATCSFTPAITLAGGAYNWWIQTFNDAGYGPWSAAMAFTVTLPPPPGAATLVTPSGAIGTNHTPTFTWNQVSSATWYYLWVNGSSGNVFKKWYTSAQAACNGTTCSFTPAITLAGGAYNWWIQTYNDGGYGPWSAAKPFTVSP